MDKMIVAIFDNETDTYNGLSSLKDLHQEGSITLYAQVVITKDEDGKVVKKEMRNVGPIGTAMGMAMGSFIGLLGGPIGVLIGASGGSLVGMLYDLNNAGVDAHFVDEVSEALIDGTTAIVADIDEDWTVPVDTKIFESNGIVFRRLRSSVEDNHIDNEIELIKNDWDDLKKSIENTPQEMQESIKKHIDRSEKKMILVENHIIAKIKNSTEEYNEKLQILEDQLKESNEKNKESINKKIEMLKTAHELHVAKLRSSKEKVNTYYNELKILNEKD